MFFAPYPFFEKKGFAPFAQAGRGTFSQSPLAILFITNARLWGGRDTYITN
jgi:hypothetical protein